jgi:tRNA A-37 threonylcarbamoyl transferase component Bud32/tetratricopeptide (TPR) repeat protein
LSALGAGGMGEVFLAHDTRLERRVAIKFVLPVSIDDAIAQERLRREALAAAALDHPFICKVFEVGETDSRTFIVMEYVEGETLQAMARRELLPTRQIAEMAIELAQALEAAHQRGVVHRDLKPSNVIVTAQGHVKVMDFGLAKRTSEIVAESASDAATVLTGSGVRIGTPAYMSPEHIVGGTVDPRSDIFSLGIILHELATGTHPFMRKDAAETMTAILRDEPASGRRSVNSLPGLEAVLRRMLAKSAAERFQTMSELRVELEALRDRVLRAAPGDAAIATSTSQSGRTPFVGRDIESSELKRLLDRMLSGEGGVALVGGEPGVGKTRLAGELLAKAQQRGCLCVTGRCFEMEGAPPFNPFIEATEQAVHLMPKVVRAAMGEQAAEISAIVPSLRRTYSDVAPVPQVPAEQQRRLVFSAYLDYLRRATQASPCVLLLDDLHWADEPSLQLLQHLAPTLASMRLLIVGTYRDVELDVNRPFAKTLETLLRQRFATRVSVRRLAESGVQQMLSALGGSSPPSGLTKAVFRETEGNPFFVEEVFRHLDEEGKLFDAARQWRPDLRVDTIDVPEGVRLVIGRRLERLGEKARKLLTAAAIIGRSFPVDVLQAAVDIAEDDVLDALDEAERAQLVVAETGQRTPRYAFVHELIRTTLEGSLSIPRRQRVHLKVADAIERLRVASLDSQASVLAHHLYQAGAAADAQRTAKFLMLAARRALTAGAFEETLEICDHLIGLELADDNPLLAEAHERRGNALVGLQRRAEAISSLDVALSRHILLNNVAAIGRAAHALIFAFMWSADIARAIETVDRALANLPQAALPERAVLESMLAFFHGTSAPDDEAWLHMDNATALAESLNDPHVQGRVLLYKFILQGASSELRAAFETGHRVMTLLRPEALWERVDLLANLVINQRKLGLLAEANALLPELERDSERAGHPMRDGLRLLSAGDEFRHNGKLSVFIALADRDTGGVSPILVLWMRGNAAVARVHLGQVDEGLREITNLIPRQHPAMRGTAQGQVFMANAMTGRADDARAVWSGVSPWLPTAGRRNSTGAWLALNGAVVGLSILADRPGCGALYPAARAWVDTGQILSTDLPIEGPRLVAGIAAHAAGLRHEARDHFETAIRQARDLPYRTLQVIAPLWYGRMLLDEADPVERARGRAMIEAAVADFRTLGMVTYGTLAETVLRSSGRS